MENNQESTPTDAAIVVLVYLAGILMVTAAVSHLTHNGFWGLLVFGLGVTALGVMGMFDL